MYGRLLMGPFTALLLVRWAHAWMLTGVQLRSAVSFDACGLLTSSWAAAWMQLAAAVLLQRRAAAEAFAALRLALLQTFFQKRFAPPA